MIDIGVNLLSSQFADDKAQVLSDAASAGVTAILLTGTTVAVSQQAAQFCENFVEQDNDRAPRCFATAGVHPHYAAEVTDDWLTVLCKLAASPAVVAMGEMGLDYFRNLSAPGVQQDVFSAQLALAAELNKPVFVHDREASADCSSLLRQHLSSLPGAVVHCFTGSREALHEYIDLGCYIGITGWVCDQRRGEELRSMVGEIPLDKLLIETDAPYLRPDNAPIDAPIDAPAGQASKRGRRRNTPALLPYVAQELAQIFEVPIATLLQATTNNAMRLFQLPTNAAVVNV